MLEIIIYGIIWCFAIYGILVMIQEIIRINKFKKIENNINLIMTVKNVENGIEGYVRNMYTIGTYKDLIIIDLESEDETMCILKELEKDNINLKVLNKNDGKDYLRAQVS